MPRVVGPWLAGSFDNDRAAAKAAVDALNIVFPTTEKIQGVRRAFQRYIVEYCRNAVLHETIQTLSDERVVSSEDAEATYYRVVATSLSVINSLIVELPLSDQEKESETYNEVFSAAKLWELVSSTDAGVRRATHKLIRACIGKKPGIIQDNVKPMSNAYVYKGLHSTQTGSALDFVRTLEAATSTFPGIWTESYSGKRTAISRLRHFVKQGSQSSSAEFWDSLNTLFPKIPLEIWPTGVEDISELLSSARSGISKREERSNAMSAWFTYFKLVDVITSPVQDAECKVILQTEVLPILQQYLYPTQENTEWNIASAKAAYVASRVSNIDRMLPLLVHRWPDFADNLIELAKMSQPEQSKDYDKSQNSVAAAGERWASLQKHCCAVNSASTIELRGVLETCNTKILNDCIALLKNRNGKPYGASAIVEHLLRSCSDYLMPSEDFRASYSELVENDMPNLIFSPSGRYLAKGLLETQLQSNLGPAFRNLLRSIVGASVLEETKIKALGNLFAQDTPNAAALTARDTLEFQQFVVKASSVASKNGITSLFTELIRLDAVTPETTDTVLSNLTASLNVASESTAGLTGIDEISRSNQPAVQKFMASPNGTGDQLLPNLLRLEQSLDDRIAEQAAALSSRLSSTISETTSSSRFAVVLQNLERVSRMSLPMDALHDLTLRLLGTERKFSDSQEILPSSELWVSALLSILEPPAPSLALMSTLGGAVHLVQPSDDQFRSRVQYDAEGFSQALRIAIYVCKLLTETEVIDALGTSKATTLACLQLSVLIAEDSVSVIGSNGLWRVRTGVESGAAILDFISEANAILATYTEELHPQIEANISSEASRFFTALEDLRVEQQAISPLSYYITACVARVYSNLFELHGFSASQTQTCETIIKNQRSVNRQLDLVSYIAGFQQPLSGTMTLTRLFNELVAYLTDANVEKDELNFFTQLNLLNTILSTQEDILRGIPKQRLIFLVKQMLGSLGSPIDTATKSEVFRGLTYLLAVIGDMYGEHWEQALENVTTAWALIVSESEYGTINEGHVLLKHTSLRLLAVLRKLARSEEPNDDLVDALKERKGKIQEGLVNLLIAANGISDEDHQPLRITHELLARQLAAAAIEKLANSDDLYPIVYAPSRSIQQAAFGLLHKEIPTLQEKVSFDVAIDKKTAQLPDELLSLVLEAPTLESLADASFQENMPLPLQGYLYSWRLLFDHFQGSSYKVKSDYIEQLKEGTYLAGLLSLTFDFLGHTNGRPVDASKLDVQDCTPDDESTPEKDVQRLLSHLYYLALTNLPGLVKSYYLEIRSRQLPQVIESWTAKHVSPLIIEASLRDVLAWAEKPKEDPEFEKVQFKVGFRSREINASYEVDEQIMSMKIVLPEAYPLASAQVMGMNRVAVNEEKWQSWLRNCQGVIAFSVSNNIPSTFQFDCVNPYGRMAASSTASPPGAGMQQEP